MKIEQVLCAGSHAVSIMNMEVSACLPGQMQGISYFLTPGGDLRMYAGGRIHGVGVKRFLLDNGYRTYGGSQAAQLVDKVNQLLGGLLVDQAIERKAAKLRSGTSGQYLSYVPFNMVLPVRKVKISAEIHLSQQLMDLDIQDHFVCIDAGLPIGFTRGWLCLPGEDIGAKPCVSYRGGILEHAAYVLCNCDVAALGVDVHLRTTGDFSDAVVEPEDRAKGYMALQVGASDQLAISLDVEGRLVVSYVQNEIIIYQRHHDYPDTVGMAIRYMAAAIVHMADETTKQGNLC